MNEVEFPCFPSGVVSLGGESEMTPRPYVKCSNRVNTFFNLITDYAERCRI